MMHDNEIGRALSSLESMKTESDGAATRSKARMLEAFDAPEQVVLTMPSEHHGPGTSAEISLLIEPNRAPQPKQRPHLWVPAVAAAVLLAVIAIQSNVPNRYDPAVVVAADSVTDESAKPIDDTQREQSRAVALFVDDDLPRLIHGTFSTTALGGTMSFVADEPVWLTRHQTDLVELSRDHRDPLAAEMAIARVDRPTAALDAHSAIEYLTRQPPGITGQTTPFIVDHVGSQSWRGRLDPASAGLTDCAPSEVCLALYDSPIELGLRPGVQNDVIERPSNTGGTFLLTASIPFAKYGVQPFETAFDELLDTISFNEPAPTNDDG